MAFGYGTVVEYPAETEATINIACKSVSAIETSKTVRVQGVENSRAERKYRKYTRVILGNPFCR